MQKDRTIAAPATTIGDGGIAIVRISGDDSERIMRQLFQPAGLCEFTSNMLYYGHIIYKGEVLDECMAVIMRAPKSYTREDVCEFHLHGGSQTINDVLSAVYDCGAFPAEPGEFTKRAFLNGRIDLSRAEAVMSLISARSKVSARAALHQLEGRTGQLIRKVQEDLLNILSSLEAAIDYPEEIDETQTLEEISSECMRLADLLRTSCDERAAKALESGLDVVICGCPNAGKSSLLNYLLNEERAIVTDIPGTTRDIVREYTYIGGIKVNLSDTAGIHDTSDPVEQIGILKARQAMNKADVVILLIEAEKRGSAQSEALKEAILSMPHIIVYSKIDLLDKCDIIPDDGVCISAKNGFGIEELKNRILSFAGNCDEIPITSVRHTRLALKAADELENASKTAKNMCAPEFCAIDLHSALDTISEITGDRIDEELLNTIFSRFCVGK